MVKSLEHRCNARGARARLGRPGDSGVLGLRAHVQHACGGDAAHATGDGAVGVSACAPSAQRAIFVEAQKIARTVVPNLDAIERARQELLTKAGRALFLCQFHVSFMYCAEKARLAVGGTSRIMY